MRFSSSTTRILIHFSLSNRKLLLFKLQGDSILLAAVNQLQVLHLLLLHREVKQAADRLIGLLFGENPGFEGLFQRFLLVVILHGGFGGTLGLAGAAAARTHSHAAHAPLRLLLLSLALLFGEHQHGLPGNLAGGVRFGLLAILVRAKLEIVPVDRNLLAVLGIHFYVHDNIMSVEVIAD